MKKKLLNDSDKMAQILEFDPGIYSIKAIKNATYDYTDKAWIKIKSKSNEKILVYIRPKLHDLKDINSLIMDFENHVLDHQIRLEVSNDFKVVREMIVAQAFEPCDNLKEIIDAVKP